MQFLFRIIRWGLAPAGIYLGIFIAFYFKYLGKFNTDVFVDAGDGLQNVWNDWWVNYAVTHLHHHPWYTQMLHFPGGTSLLGQTLNPFNGFLAIPFLWFFSLIQTFNIIFILTFVLAGLTAFWLCYDVTKTYWASIVGGAIFTYSSYHISHSVGHMQLVSLEWIPLFILLWLRVWQRPKYVTAIGAAVSLFLVLLCDYYYFFYSILAALIISLYFVVNRRRGVLHRDLLGPLAAFAFTAAALTGPIALKLLLLNAHDPLSGSHPADLFGTDLLAVVVPGPAWYFNEITQWAWRLIPGGSPETDVSLGITVIALIVTSFILRHRFRGVGLWQIIMLFFGVMSLGPYLRIWGHMFHRIALPYQLLAAAVPSLKLSGVPVRMMVMVTLSAAVIAAMVLGTVHVQSLRQRLVAAAFLAIMVFEFWPTGMSTTPLATNPDYVNALRTLPAGAVIDNAALTASNVLYYQTIHEKPLVYGYISRTPHSVELADAGIADAERRGDYDGLCSVFHIRYLAQKRGWATRNAGSLPRNSVYSDSQSVIYDLKNAPGC